MSDISELDRWIEETSGAHWLWHAKYLSANDTYAKPNVHQGGPYLAKELVTAAFPELTARSTIDDNPDLWVNASIDSHGWVDDVRAIWYNSKLAKHQKNGRNEVRLTNWGGAGNPLVAPEATGALVVFAFRHEPGRDAGQVRIWIARTPAEEDRLLELVGDAEPGRPVLWSPAGDLPAELPTGPCAVGRDALPAGWELQFPTGEEIVQWVLANRRAFSSLSPDDRLLKRLKCEYELFRSIEVEYVLPRITTGFETVDAFVQYANSVANRRKSRAGRSLELQTKAILREEGVPHSWTPTTEGARKPDFIFPSIEDYRDRTRPDSRLLMLASKTTAKDRWRQILNEADRIRVKHLLTLQEGVSAQQHEEMTEEGVVLVVPEKLIKSYPDEVQPALITLQEFIGLARAL